MKHFNKGDKIKFNNLRDNGTRIPDKFSWEGTKELCKKLGLVPAEWGALHSNEGIVMYNSMEDQTLVEYNMGKEHSFQKGCLLFENEVLELVTSEQYPIF